MVFLSAIQFAKKVKSKNILVLVESTVSGHKIMRVRERLGDKLEFMNYDPFVQQITLYRERKRIRSL